VGVGGRGGARVGVGGRVGVGVWVGGWASVRARARACVRVHLLRMTRIIHGTSDGTVPPAVLCCANMCCCRLLITSLVAMTCTRPASLTRRLKSMAKPLSCTTRMCHSSQTGATPALLPGCAAWCSAVAVLVGRPPPCQLRVQCFSLGFSRLSVSWTSDGSISRLNPKP
jgi:hypothetical protein